MTTRRGLMLIAALLAAIPLTIIIDPGPDHHPSVTVTIGRPLVPAATAVDGADQDAKPDDPVILNKQAREVAADFAIHKYDLHGKLTGPIVGPVAKLEPPFAADSVPGCRTRFLKTNWSARTVSQDRVVLFWLHYTGGPDKPNSRADVDGLTAFGNSPAARVSWHFNMDKDGNCDYNVPLRDKAWTEAGANSTGISIEVAGRGEAPYLRAGGVRELRRIIDEVRKAYPGVQLRLGAVKNCQPTRSGIVTHWMGGPCSGGHVDIKPLDLVTVIDELKAAGPRPVTSIDRTTCRKLNWWRTHGRPPGKAEANAVRRRRALDKRGVTCTNSGPARR